MDATRLRRARRVLVLVGVLGGCADETGSLDPTGVDDAGIEDSAASVPRDASVDLDAGPSDTTADAGVGACPPTGQSGSWASPTRLLTRDLYRFTTASDANGEMVAVGFGRGGLQTRLRRAGAWQPPSPLVSAPGLLEVAAQPSGAPAYIARSSRTCGERGPCEEQLSVLTVTPGDPPSAAQVPPGGFEGVYPSALDVPMRSADDLRVAFAARLPTEDRERSVGFYMARRRAGVWAGPTFEASLVPPTSCCLSGDLASNQEGDSALVIQDASDPNRLRQRMTLGPLTDTGYDPRWTWEVEYSANFAARPRVWVGEDGVGYVFYVAGDPEGPCPAGPECAAGCTRLYRRGFDLRGGALGEVEVMSSAETGVAGRFSVVSDGPESLVASWWQSATPTPSCELTPDVGTLQASEWTDGRWTELRGVDDLVEPGRQRRLPPSRVARVVARRGPDGRLALLWTVEGGVQAAVRQLDGRWITSEACADPWPSDAASAEHVAWSPPGGFHFFFYDGGGAYEVTSP